MKVGECEWEGLKVQRTHEYPKSRSYFSPAPQAHNFSDSPSGPVDGRTIS